MIARRRKLSERDIEAKFKLALSYVTGQISLGHPLYRRIIGISMLMDLDRLDYTPAQLALGQARLKSLSPNYKEAIRVLLAVSLKNEWPRTQQAETLLRGLRMKLGDKAYKAYVSEAQRPIRKKKTTEPDVPVAA